MVSKKRKKFKLLKIIVIAIVFVIAAAVLVVIRTYGFSNIMALYRGLTTKPEKIQNLLDQNKQATDKALADIGVTVEENMVERIEKGELTEDELAAMIYESMQNPETVTAETGDVSGSQGEEDYVIVPAEEENTTPSSTNSNGQNDGGSTGGPDNSGAGAGNTGANADGNVNEPKTLTAEEEEFNKRTAELVAKMYVIKADFMGTLSSFEANIKAQYKSLPAEERTQATKAKIVSENMSYITGLEAQCDAQVKAVTDELTELLTANGKDTSLVDAINSAYANEKELKKAYYISLYNK
ncbi:MAG: hypothetical protein K6D98_03540 [Clostridiales bacterium]|nr:hypothetical protein [Clostridiales bacterium]